MDDATNLAALRSLRDVAGVLGSFLLDREGRPVVADLPAMFDEGALISSGERLARLRAALEIGGESFEGCTSRFGEHLLVMRRVPTGTLCVLGLSDVSHATLNMGLSLVVRRISAEPSSVDSTPPPAAGSVTRFFRGRQL
jgi:hypothetical protein